MLKLGRALLLVICLVLAFIALFMTVIYLGDRGTDAPVFRAIALTWIVAAPLIFVCVFAYRRLTVAEKQQAQEQTRQTLAMAKGLSHLEASGRPIVQPLGFVFLGLLCGFGVWAAANERNWLMLVICALGLIAIAVLGLELMRQALRPGPMLTLDMRGISHAMYGLIRWPDVAGIALNKVQVRGATIHSLQVGVRSPHRYLEQAPWLLRWRKRAWLQERPAFGALEIPLNALNKNPELIYQTALALRLKDTTPLLSHWQASMNEQQVKALLSMQQLTGQLQAAPANIAPAELESIMRRMEALKPDLESAVKQDLERLKRVKRKGYVVTGLVLGFFVLRVASKLLR
jgi:hypothetical protein